MTAPDKHLRCAIYTRVSTDAGLDQEFNSLDAQREAAEAFIKSQQHEGWKLIPTSYDDGGYSGGSLDRPGLQKLLMDIQAGNIDVILVYKVDRLTRSLADFAKLVEIFDKHGVFFVSVTQAFNTTNSMGRLTLNVLLSFAQFEREVTAERIRDKVAASKKNGIWMGGSVPLGYRVENRKLLVEESEAKTVQMIFARYLELGSIIALIEDLRHNGIRSRVRNIAGKQVGGVPFTAGPLTYLLKNRIYIGEIVHKGQSYNGEHAPIIEVSLFEAVQAKLVTNQVSSERRSGNSDAALMGKIFDDRGNVMTPRHAQKGQRRYYYYTSRAFIEGRKEEAGSIARVAANDIEPKIALALAQSTKTRTQNDASLSVEDERKLLDTHVSKVVIHGDHLKIFLMGELAAKGAAVSIPWKRRPRRLKREIMFAGPQPDPHPIKAKTRKLLVRSIARARTWLNELVSGKAESVEFIAQRENCSARSVHMTLGLAFLAPDIVAAAVTGKLPRGFGITNLCNLPPLWVDQRKALSS